MLSPLFRKVFSVWSLRHDPISVHAVQIDPNTYACIWSPFPQSCNVSLIPKLSPTLGGTLSHQAAVPCLRQHFACRALPSSNGSTPQPGNSCTHGCDPTGTNMHTRTNFHSHLFGFSSKQVTHSWPPRQGWITEQTFSLNWLMTNNNHQETQNDCKCRCCLVCSLFCLFQSRGIM